MLFPQYHLAPLFIYSLTRNEVLYKLYNNNKNLYFNRFRGCRSYKVATPYTVLL